MSVAVVKHLAWSGKWSASAVMVHDNSVKRRVLYHRKSSAPLCLHFAPVFWKSERAVVEQRAQVTDHHQSILAWLAWGREGLVGGCLKCLGLRHVVSDGGGLEGYEDETLMSYSAQHDDTHHTWSATDCHGNRPFPTLRGGKAETEKFWWIKEEAARNAYVYVWAH